MNLYLIGGSSEMELVSGFMRRLEAAGHKITFDWPKNISSVGQPNPRDASERDRMRWSLEDLNGIANAHLVWVLLPQKPSFGCAFEFGFAHRSHKTVFVSGDWRASIFTALSDRRFDTHEEAFQYICGAGWNR